MPLVPIAAFLTGALLSLLLPTLLLIALVVWYVRFIGRVPGPADASEPARPAPGSDVSAGPNVRQTDDSPEAPRTGAEAADQS